MTEEIEVAYGIVRYLCSRYRELGLQTFEAGAKN